MSNIFLSQVQWRTMYATSKLAFPTLPYNETTKLPQANKSNWEVQMESGFWQKGRLKLS